MIDCSTCGDDHATDDCTYRTPCAYCSRPAVIESSVGLDGDYSEPNEIGQRAYEAPRPEPRCEECEADFERVARRRNWLAQEGWI